jgi:hypothetical protein
MRYQVQVRAFANGHLPSSYTLSDIMNRLESPDQQPLQYENGKLLVKLANTVANAKSYQARLVISGSALETMSTMEQSAEDPAQYSTEFSLSNETVGLNYQVQVRAMAANYLPSIWKISTDSLAIIGVPQNVKLNLSDSKDAIKVNWDAVTNATDYEVQITDATGNPLSNQPVFTTKNSQNNTVTWQFAVMADLLADDIKAQVRAKAPNQVSAWSALSDVFILSGLEAPTNVQLAYANNVFTITWDDPAGDVDYEVQLLTGDQQVVLDPQPEADFSGKQATISASTVSGGTIVRARVRAKEAQFRSLLKNGDATDSFNNWQILANGGDRWQIEDGPAASCPGTEGATNFVTSYDWDKKAQTIDLLAEGFEQAYLDNAPDIQISEWICSRSDCRGQYQLIVELRDASQNVIQRFDTGVIEAPIAPNWVYPWEKVAHQFSAYGSGVRFIYFEHSGKDMNWWAGSYGSKMTGARVFVKTPLSGSVKTSDWSAVSNAITTPTAGPTIASVTPADQVAAGFGQLLFIHGNKLPKVVVFSQGGHEFTPQWTAFTGSAELAIVRLSLDLKPGAATVRLTDTANLVSTPDFPLTIAEIPGAPVITAIMSYPNMTAVTKVSPGQKIAIAAEGMDTSRAIIEWTHPTQSTLTSPSELTMGIPNGTVLSVVTTVPSITPNDTWTLSLRVSVNAKLSAACLWSLQT